MEVQDPFDSPELAPDLEWMLQSTTAGEEVIARKMIEEFFPGIYCLAMGMLRDGLQAKQAARETLISLLLDRHRYRENIGLSAWFYKHALDTVWKLIPKRNLIGKARNTRPRYGLGKNPGTFLAREEDTAGLVPVFQWPDFIEGFQEADRLVLLLTSRLGLEGNLVAGMLQTTPGRINACVQEATRRLNDPDQSESPAISPHERVLEDMLGVLLPLPQITEDQKEALVVSIVQEAAKRRSRHRVALAFVEVLLVGVSILVGSSLGWVVNNQKDGETSLSQARTVVVTKIVARNYYVEVTPTPGVAKKPAQSTPASTPKTPPPTLVSLPLPYDSPPEAVLERVRKSYASYSTLWLNAKITFQGPQGYQGGPLTYWVQIGMDNREGNLLVVSGTGERSLDEAFLIRGSHYYHLSDMASNQDYHFQEIQGTLPVRGEYLSRLIQFPVTVFQDVPLFNQVTGKDDLAGRGAIVLDQLRPDRKLVARLWVDRVTGFPLRQIIYSKVNPNQVLEEVQVTSIAFNPDLPPGLFSLDFSWRNQFAQGEQNPPLTLSAGSTSTPYPNTTLGEVPKISPPPGIDLRSALLNFHFFEKWTVKAGSIASIKQDADIYGDGYYLGTWEMSDPLNLLCVRSPDGKKIVFVNRWNNQFYNSDPVKYPYSRETAVWFDLSMPEIEHPIQAVGAVAMAFAPDNRRLAIMGTFPENGIYIYDTESGDLHKLINLTDARSLVWSPDGKFLAMIATIYPSEGDTIIVLNTSSGNVVYKQSVDVEKGVSVKKDWPILQWGVEFPVDTIASLEGCSAGN